MTGSGAKRPHVRLEIDGAAWDVYEAWVSPSGLGLLYFLCEDGGAEDRRAALEGGQRLEALAPEALEAAWHGASGLTPTERRLTVPDGEIWLVQGVGPVWAEGGSASDAIGVRARCLSADRPLRERTGIGPDALSDDEISAWVGIEPDASD